MGYFKTAALLGILTGIILALGGLLGGRQGIVVALVLAAVMNFVSYWFSDRIVLAAYRAREVGPQEAPRLHAIVSRLAERAGIPMPRVYVVNEPSPNAFATGRNPRHAAIAATTGLLDLMDDDEVEGVLGHELGHVKNRDILIASVAATVAGAIAMVASMARWGALLGGGRGGREGSGAFGVVALVVASVVAPVAAAIIQACISRTREFAADRTGAEIVGNPEPLARALLKLDGASRRMPMPAHPATQHLFIVKPFSGASLARLFSTHPPIEERVRRLRGARA